MNKYRIYIEFDCTKEDLEDYCFDHPETIGDIRKNVIKLFENDYENVDCKIKVKEDEETNA